MKKDPLLLALLALIVATTAHAQTLPAAAKPPPPATAAAPASFATPEAPDIAAIKPNPFLVAHDSFVKIAQEGKSELLFLGDSITAGWGGQKDIWNTAFGTYKPANFGIGGDRTQHVLWRITNGELDKFTPKGVVLMIGTNNSSGDSAEAIAGGVTKIVKTIREKSPKTKILLLAVFPRGEKPSPIREKIKAVNDIIAKLDDRQHVFYLDIGDKFLEAEGTLTKEIMPDFLHLSQKGYQIWADAITPTLADLMK
jgi:lysophospholipase L1-like esterase